MTYRPGDHWLIDDRSEFQIRRSDAVVEAETGFVVARGTDDPKHPLEAIIRPRKAYAPRLIRPEPADVFLEPNEQTADDL